MEDAALGGRAAYAIERDIANRVLTAASANLERTAKNAAAVGAVRTTHDETLPRRAAQGSAGLARPRVGQGRSIKLGPRAPAPEQARAWASHHPIGSGVPEALALSSHRQGALRSCSVSRSHGDPLQEGGDEARLPRS